MINENKKDRVVRQFVTYCRMALNMESDSCHSSVAGGIYNLRKKIEPDSKKPTYIKTVLGVSYKFNG